MNSKMMKYIVKNSMRFITLLFAVSLISFLLVEASPVDPIRSYVGSGDAVSLMQRENIAKYWGLEQSPAKRFIAWGSAFLKGDMGVSLIYRQPVREIIKDRFLNSLLLMTLAWVISGIVGYGAGLFMGANKTTKRGKILRGICFALSSTPSFWLGLLLLMIFSVWLGIMPIGFSMPVGVLETEVTIWQRLHHIALPALTLSLVSFGSIALHTSEKAEDILHRDYILYARARGESKRSVIWRHVFKNTLLPAITLQFSAFSELFGGSILAEQVFSYPGLGQAAVQAGLGGDVPLLLGITICSAVFVFAGNLTASILYAVIDPRIREGGIS